jgi:hypothetical protein
MDNDLEATIRRIIREETGLTPVAPAEKWRGGELVLKPGSPGLQEKSWPIESFFHKGRDAEESPAHARAAGQRVGAARRSESEACSRTSRAVTDR